MFITRLCVGLIAGILLLAGVASGQNFPNKPIRIVTVAAGGDSVSRLLVQDFSTTLGQPVVIDNRPGYISGEIVSKAPPDGYTLLVANNNFFYGPLLQTIAYDPVKDFTPISLLSSSPQVLLVSPTVAANNVAELIALAKAKPGYLNYASAQSGGSGHLTSELFKAAAGVDIVRVAYKGTALAVPDLIDGRVHMEFESIAVAIPLVKAGKLKGLAVTSLKPSPLVPNMPTVAASLPGFEMLSVSTMFAPAKTPTPIVKKLNEEAVRVLKKPDMQEKFFNSGLSVVASSPEELGTWMKGAVDRMAKVIKDAGIRAD